MWSEDDDLAMLSEVGRLEVATLFDVQPAHSSIRQIDGLRGDVNHLRSIFETESIIGLGTDRSEERDRIANGLSISIEKLDLLTGALTASLHAGLAAPHHD